MHPAAFSQLPVHLAMSIYEILIRFALPLAAITTLGLVSMERVVAIPQHGLLGTGVSSTPATAQSRMEQSGGQA